jgi:elongation factor P
MVSIATNQFSNGITLRINGELYDLIFFEFVKPGKGGAFVRTKMRNLKTGTQKELTFTTSAGRGLPV